MKTRKRNPKSVMEKLNPLEGGEGTESFVGKEDPWMMIDEESQEGEKTGLGLNL